MSESGNPNLIVYDYEEDDTGCVRLKVVSDVPYTTQDAERLARLIEAANDLFEALADIMNANDSPPGTTTGQARICDLYAEAARAAIAKVDIR